MRNHARTVNDDFAVTLFRKRRRDSRDDSRGRPGWARVTVEMCGESELREIRRRDGAKVEKRWGDTRGMCSTLRKSAVAEASSAGTGDARIANCHNERSRSDASRFDTETLPPSFTTSRTYSPLAMSLPVVNININYEAEKGTLSFGAVVLPIVHDTSQRKSRLSSQHSQRRTGTLSATSQISTSMNHKIDHQLIG